ncbi:hypothetical protein D918_01277 [Trichuris suis]
MSMDENSMRLWEMQASNDAAFKLSALMNSSTALKMTKFVNATRNEKFEVMYKFFAQPTVCDDYSDLLTVHVMNNKLCPLDPAKPQIRCRVGCTPSTDIYLAVCKDPTTKRITFRYP